MAKNGGSKGLQDILLQGLNTQAQSSVSSQREERQQIREEKREERQAERDARKKGGGGEDGTVAPGSGTDTGGPILGGPIFGDPFGGIANLVANGTSGNDVLSGTDAPDVLDGLEGNDTLYGLGDPDTLFGSSGQDTIFGGSGVDEVFGGLGNDTAFGGLDDDKIIDGGEGVIFNGPDQTVNGSNSLVDVLSFATPLSDGSGGYVVGWGQGLGASSSPQAVLVQRYDSAGNAVGDPVRFDTAIPSTGPFHDKGEVQLIALQGGNAGKFAAVFFSYNVGVIPEDDHNAYLVIFNADGTIQGTAQLSPGIEFTQSRPTVSALSDGSVVVAWQDQWRDTGGAGPEGWGIYAQRYTVPGAGNPATFGPDTHVSSNQLAGNQALPQSIALSNGNVVFLWTTDNNIGAASTDAYMRIYTPGFGLTAVTAPTIVSSQVAGTQFAHYKNMAVLNDSVGQGSFIVVWRGQGPGGTDTNGIFFRRFNNDGTAIDLVDRQANDTTGTAEEWASVTALADGGFFIVWQGADVSGQGIFGQRFDANGNEVGSQIQINSITTGDQQQPTVATLPNGVVVVTWDGPEGGDSGVFQRLIRFGSNGGDDVFHGDQGNDFILGESGNDQLFGGEGSDSLDGGTGNDILTGGSSADALFGGGGGDFASYAGSPLAVTVDLSAGTGTGGDALNDAIQGVEHLIGSEFNDTLTGLGDTAPDEFARSNSIIGNGGNDVLFGLAGIDTLFGDDLPAFSAKLGNDNMFGGSGVDVMFGGGGNDTMAGGADADTVYGDTNVTNDLVGVDAADYRISPAAVTVILNNGVAESGGHAAGDTLVGIEVVLGSSFNDSFGNASGAATFFGNDGNDTLLGAVGAESIVGGSGGDVVSYLNSNAGVNVNLGAGTSSGGFAAGDFHTGVETLIGSELADTLRGNNNGGSVPDDLVIGGSGDDMLLSSAGRDTLVGGTGADTVNYNGNGTGVYVNLLAGSHFDFIPAGSDDRLIEIENAIGTTHADTLIGSDAVNSLFGGLANDILLGGANADLLEGGGGGDTASYDGSHLGVYVNLTDASPESFGHAEGDVLSSVESLIGSSLADTLITSSGAEENAISGGEGDDTMDGRDGADSFNGGTGSDWVYYNDSGAAVDVNLVDAAVEAGGFATGDSLTFVENLLGSHFDDSLVAGVRINTLDGATGNDFLQGGAEADVLIGGIGIDTASYDSSPGGVTVDLSDDAPEVGNDAQGDTLTQVENLIGSSFNDHLIATDDVNTVVAGDSDDTVEGGDAADSLFGGTGFDWVDYTNSDWGVTVTLGSTNAQTGEIDGDQIGDVLSGFEAVKGANDNDIGDTLTSVLSSAILDGQLGDDFFIAGAGSDTFIGGLGSDTVDYRTSATAVNVNLVTGIGSGGLAAGDLYTGVENVLGTSGNDIMVGIAGFTTFVGFSGADSMFGGSSTDSLMGDSGDDFLQGGSGADSIIGGVGSNDFAVYTNDASQTQGVTIDLTTGIGSGGDASGPPEDEDNDGTIDFPGGNETLFGIEHVIGSGNNDSINGDEGVNWLFGASGIDALRGAGGNDTLFGGDGNDLLGGFAPGAVDTGADSLFGDTGNDSLFYDPNDAALSGGLGNDLLIGRSVADNIQLDTARFQFNNFADIETFDLGDGNDVFLNTSSVTDLVNIGQGLNVFGGSGRDQISMRGAAGVFSGMDDNLDGGAGNDIIWGGFGHDGISGGEGDDQLYGGKGDEKFFGGQGFDVFYIGQAEGTDLIFDDAQEVNGLVLFWGWDSTFPAGSGADVFDGVDPDEIMIDYNGNSVTITFTERGGTVTFERVDNGDGTWDSTVDIINLWDYGNGDAGNSTTVPPTFGRDVWSATFDATTGEFTAFTLAVNG